MVRASTVLRVVTAVAGVGSGAVWERRRRQELDERRRAEERVAALEHELGERLRAVEDIKATFLNAVSHELRTPLTVMLGAAETLHGHWRELDDEQVERMLGAMRRNAHRLDHLLAELLDLDRLDRGVLEPRRQQTDLLVLVHGVLLESGLAATHDVHLDLAPLVADVDGAKVQRLVESLLTNVARHTPPATPVWIRLEAVDGGVLLVVDDAGPGVSSEVRDSVFERFRQGGAAASSGPGTGVGLALVAGFARLHGGRAWLEDRSGGGSSFRVLLACEHVDRADRVDHPSVSTPLEPGS